jgi:hypothetical protein
MHTYIGYREMNLITRLQRLPTPDGRMKFDRRDNDVRNYSIIMPLLKGVGYHIVVFLEVILQN